jgi:pimeloyl-ACP methyl ester carboxylesterase
MHSPHSATDRPNLLVPPTVARVLRVPSTDGVDLALHDLGGSGPPLLLFHATGFHGRTYLPMAAALTDRFHVWAPDFRGHGASTPPYDEDFAWRGMADDVLACADALGISGFHAFGHSMGGTAALLAESRRPGLLRSAYFFEPIFIPSDWAAVPHDNVMEQAARRRREVFPSRAEALYRYASKTVLGRELRADSLAAYVEYGFDDLPEGGVRLACRAEHEARTFAAEDKMTFELLAEIDVPAVVAIGHLTASPGPADGARVVAERLPHARLVEYDFLGHFGPLQDPDRIAADIAGAAV